MSQMRPPPLPGRKVSELLEPIGDARVGDLIRRDEPFLPAEEVVTLPGIPGLDDPVALRAANERLRMTLARVRGERDDALTSLRDSAPPPPTRRQKATRFSLQLGKWAVLLPVVALVGRAAAKQWPAFGLLIEGILTGMGL